MSLDEYIRAAFLRVIIEIYEAATPACDVHEEKALSIFCRDCENEGCNECWM